MKVTIITSCFNREKTIRGAMESVLAQDYSNIEYIVVDGASSDNSLNIIKHFEEKVTRIISEPDNGMYEGINKGICAATGDFIGLMHSDDLFYSTDVISKLVKHLEESKADIIYGNGLFVDRDNTNKVVRKWISGSYSKTKIKSGWLPLHPTVYIRKKCFDELGLYDESFHIAADSDLLVRYLYEGHFNITYLDQYIVKMRMGGLSTSVKKIKQKWREDLHLYKSHGFNPYWALICKVISKIPQFVTAKFYR